MLQPYQFQSDRSRSLHNTVSKIPKTSTLTNEILLGNQQVTQLDQELRGQGHHLDEPNPSEKSMD